MNAATQLSPALASTSLSNSTYFRPLRAETDALQRHLQQCRRARSRWFDAARVVEQAHRFIAPRFVTTVTAVSVVLALSFGWL